MHTRAESDDINNMTIKGGNWTYDQPAVHALLGVAANQPFPRKPLPFVFVSDARSISTKPYRHDFEYLDQVEVRAWRCGRAVAALWLRCGRAVPPPAPALCPAALAQWKRPCDQRPHRMVSTSDRRNALCPGTLRASYMSSRECAASGWARAYSRAASGLVIRRYWRRC